MASSVGSVSRKNVTLVAGRAMLRKAPLMLPTFVVIRTTRYVMDRAKAAPRMNPRMKKRAAILVP